MLDTQIRYNGLSSYKLRRKLDKWYVFQVSILSTSSPGIQMAAMMWAFPSAIASAMASIKAVSTVTAKIYNVHCVIPEKIGQE